MSRQKGSVKTGGRQKGTPTKVTSDIRAWLSDLINKNRSQIEKDLLELEPKDRLIIIERLMQYSVPKMKSIETKIELNELTNEQLDYIISDLTKAI